MLVKYFRFNDFENSEKLYETSNFSKHTVRDAKTLESTKKYAPKKCICVPRMNCDIPHGAYAARRAATSIRNKENTTVLELGPSPGMFQTFRVSLRVSVTNASVQIL